MSEQHRQLHGDLAISVVAVGGLLLLAASFGRLPHQILLWGGLASWLFLFSLLFSQSSLIEHMVGATILAAFWVALAYDATRGHAVAIIAGAGWLWLSILAGDVLRRNF